MATVSTPEVSNSNVQGLGLTNPGYDPKKPLPKKPPQRAIADENQAARICTKLVNDAREANAKNRRIMAKYNAERPFVQQNLDNDGLGWKTNISTQPLASMVDRISPRFERAVENVRYLTSSKLPDDHPGASKKTEAFRKEITTLCRESPGWQEFVGDIAQEFALFGWTTVAQADEYSWFPTHYRQDRAFFPTLTKQCSDDTEVALLIEDWKPHELVDILRDKDAAIDAGWDFENSVEAINMAMPLNHRSGQSDHNRIYEDLYREANTASGYYDSARVIQVYALYVKEANGKVSLWRLNNTPGTSTWRLMFKAEDLYDKMSDFLTFFAFQKANGTLKGSKGVGRIVYDMANVIDRTRNEVTDRLQLSGKILVQGDEKQIPRFRMSVFGNAILIGSEFEVNQKSIDPKVKEFFQLDQFMSMILNEQSGNVTPRQFEGERTTKAEVEIFAAREEEQKDNPIARFLMQFSRMMTTLQKRAVSSKCDCKRAKAMRKRLLEIMDEEELDMIADSASAEVVKDLTDLERQQIILVATENAGNPLVDQEEMLRRKLTAQVDSEFAEAVMNPLNDPIQTAEQTRMQQMENVLIATGSQVAVSPRDNHILHLDALLPELDRAMQGAETDPNISEILKGLVAHGQQHIQQATAQGMKKAELSEYLATLNKVSQVVQQLDAYDQSVADAVDQGVPADQAVAAGQEAAVVAAAGQQGAPAGPPAV